MSIPNKSKLDIAKIYYLSLFYIFMSLANVMKYEKEIRAINNGKANTRMLWSFSDYIIA